MSILPITLLLPQVVVETSPKVVLRLVSVHLVRCIASLLRDRDKTANTSHYLDDPSTGNNLANRSEE